MFVVRAMLISSCAVALLIQRPPKWLLWMIEKSYIALAFAIVARLFTVAEEIPPLLEQLAHSPFEPLPLVLASYLFFFFGAAQLFKEVAFNARAKRALIYGA